MRTLYLSNAPILGGTARILQSWLMFGRELGWNSRLVVPTHSDLVEWAQRERIPTLVDPIPGPSGRLPVKAMWHAWRVARFAGRGIDLIHCNEHNIYPFLFLLRKFIDAPVVCHVRYKLEREWALWAFRGSRCPDALLWTSEQQREDSASAVAGIVPESRQHVVRLGFDVNSYGIDCGQRAATRQALGIDDDEILVGTASPLRPRKRVHEFIEMARRLAPRHPKAVFLIAGGSVAGDEAYREQIEQAVRESQLGRRLRWLGFLEPVEPFFHGSDIQVSTSEYETFGNSVCEAMACARPVAAYRGGSVAEVLGDAGLVTETGDLDALTAAVERLIAGAELRQSLGTAARRRVAENFNSRNSFEKLLGIYQSVLGHSAAAQALPTNQTGPVAASHPRPTRLKSRTSAKTSMGVSVMNVLYLTNNAGRASTTVATRGWFEHLMPLGLRPVMASPLVGEFSDWGAARGVKTYQMQLPNPSKSNPLPFALALWRLTVVARRHRVQLIHCNEQNIYPIGSYLSRLTGIPAVVSVHFSMGPGLCKWMFAGRRCPSRIFFISKGSLAECRKGVTGIVPEDRWRLLPNGLDLEHYRPDELLGRAFRSQHKLGDGVLAGVACAFRSRKQLEHLFLVAKRLPADVRIVVAGGPVPDEADYAARLICDAQRELGDRFVHVGYLTDLRGFCNALDIFVNTSREEACCISVLEAMACGCPVVGYPSKSVDGQVLPGGGAIVAQDDVDALAAEMMKWCRDTQLRTTGSQGARQRVKDEFDIRKLSLAVWDEYRDLIGRCSSSLVAASL